MHGKSSLHIFQDTFLAATCFGSLLVGVPKSLAPKNSEEREKGVQSSRMEEIENGAFKIADCTFQFFCSDTTGTTTAAADDVLL